MSYFTRRRVVHRALPFFLLLTTWEGLALIDTISPTLLPSPTIVFARAWRLSLNGVLLQHTAASLGRLTLGFGIGGALGILLGLILAEVRIARDWLKPLIDFMQSIPTLAWIPVIIVWCGLGIQATIVIMSLGVLWPIVINTDVGIRSVSPTLILIARSLGASHLSCAVRVLAPATLPHILAGARVGMSRGWRALIIAETFAGAQRGIGTMIFAGREYFRMDDVLLGVLVIGCLSLLMERVLFEQLETHTIQRWGMARIVT